ncbi:cell wall anchor protein [Cochleicola gelatinilyticus]|nr:cell wall anchor protein [Cochleicola gelatinilyticus]
MGAQVGIGTTNPHPSSIIDMTSTEGGLLTPRMNTLDRVGISSPAKGLLVFDTDLDQFYYFDGTVWTPIGANDKRNNYKLVKDISDLADELVAGGGSRYLMNANYLYEINGIITFDFPIEMNSSYIEGVDVSEDVLYNNSGSTLFIGTTGGSMRNLTINANGNQIFNITGSGASNIICNSMIYLGASSIGSISGMNVVYFNVSQYVGNTTGLSMSNISTAFMQNVFWTASNTGTFLTLTGSITNFQAANGRIVVDSGETGVNVSGNPTIVNSAAISAISFIGAGDRVNGYTSGSYTGFNFTNAWNVRCQGIPEETDNEAAGNFYNTNTLSTGFTQSITNGTAQEIQGNGTFAADKLFRFNATGGNRLTYTGVDARNFQVSASVSLRVTNADTNFYAVVLAKNGVLVTESNAVVYIANDAQIQNVSINSVVSLVSGDFIELYVQRLTGSGTDTLVVFSENLSIK